MKFPAGFVLQVAESTGRGEEWEKQFAVWRLWIWALLHSSRLGREAMGFEIRGNFIAGKVAERERSKQESDPLRYLFADKKKKKIGYHMWLNMDDLLTFYFLKIYFVWNSVNFFFMTFFMVINEITRYCIKYWYDELIHSFCMSNWVKNAFYVYSIHFLLYLWSCLF